MHDTWIAVQGCTKKQLRDALELEETGEPWAGPRRSTDFAYGELPGGWVVLWVEQDGFVAWQDVIDASRLGFTVALRLQDQVDTISVLAGARDGAILWEVNAIRDNLTIVGTTPPELDPIHERLTSASELAECDIAFHDIPQELSEALCGIALNDAEPAFVPLRPKAGSRWTDEACNDRLPFGSREGEPMSSTGFVDKLRNFIGKVFVFVVALLLISVLYARLFGDGS